MDTFFYDNTNLNQDENFMRFSREPVLEDSELNLGSASSLLIFIEPAQFKLGDEFSYQFCNQISQFYKGFQVVLGT